MILVIFWLVMFAVIHCWDCGLIIKLMVVRVVRIFIRGV